MSFLVLVTTLVLLPSRRYAFNLVQGFFCKIYEKKHEDVMETSLKANDDKRNENKQRNEIRVVVHRNSVCSSIMRLPFGSCPIRRVAIINFHISSHFERKTIKAIILPFICINIIDRLSQVLVYMHCFPQRNVIILAAQGLFTFSPRAESVRTLNSVYVSKVKSKDTEMQRTKSRGSQHSLGALVMLATGR